MNIVMIVSDTLRKDHLGCYGNERIFTPHLDRFARERCVQFDRCYTASFPTMPNRADLLTGKLAFSYLGWAPLPSKEIVLPEILSRSGYTTIAVVDTPFFLRKGYGYDRGFRDFVWVPGQGSERPRIDFQRKYEGDYCAPATMSMAEKMLERYHKEKFFLYVDTWDPHEPWDPPSWRVERYYPGYDGRIVNPCYSKWRDFGMTEEDVKIAHACYCGEVSMVDHWVGRLLDKIESLGLLDDTMVVFTSDHGFYFGEHEYFGKGMQEGCPWQQTKHGVAEEFFGGEGEKTWYSWLRSPLYEEIIRVPLLISLPGRSPGRTRAMVSSVDLMPTILELAKVKIPSVAQGRSLVPLLHEKEDSVHDFVVSSWPLYNVGEQTRMVDDWVRKIKEPEPSTITAGDMALLYTMEGYPAELYDIKSDPRQSQNIINENWEIARELHQRFVKFLEIIGTAEYLIAPRRTLSKL